MADALVSRQDGDVRRIWLNRPERRNALDPHLIDLLDCEISDAGRDDLTRIIVIAGNGPSFCSGADLGYLYELASRRLDPAHFMGRVSDCFTRIEQASKPVVALVHGHVVAGGLELALACDVVVAHAGTLIGDGHARNGLLPAGGASVRLPRKVGANLARWLILSGELVPAEDLLTCRFVHAIASADQAELVLGEVLAALREATHESQRLGKRLLSRQHEEELTRGLALERAAFATNWDSDRLVEQLERFSRSGAPTEGAISGG
jgi:enoyl-CoA hydratase